MAWTPTEELTLAEILKTAAPGTTWSTVTSDLNERLFSYAAHDSVQGLLLTQKVRVYAPDDVRKKAKRMGLGLPPEPEFVPFTLEPTDEFIGIRTVYADIEATDLGASWGHLLCCSFSDEWGKVHTLRLDDPRFRNPDNLADDSKLAIAIRDELQKYDLIVGHNFLLYDRPFINARLMLVDEAPVKESLLWDTLFQVGGRNLRIGSRRLDTVAKFFSLGVQKTPLTGQTWQQAAAGVTAAMDEVVDHCEHDVLVERLVFKKLKPFVKIIHR